MHHKSKNIASDSFGQEIDLANLMVSKKGKICIGGGVYQVAYDG